MIPLKDNIPAQTFPFVNYTLILMNTLIFFYEISIGSGAVKFLNVYGFIPASLQEALHGGVPESIWQLPVWWQPLRSLFTSLFLHGGWWHFLGNMLYLWIFGDNVEDRMGHGRYIVFYLLCGLAANFAHYLSNPLQTAPTIGASGAIAGVLGAYFVLYPYARVLTMVPIFIFIQFFQLPAFLLLGIWFLQQYLLGVLNPGLPGHGGVAWWAHIGGFLTGLLLIFVFQKKSRRPNASQYWTKKRRGYIRYY